MPMLSMNGPDTNWSVLEKLNNHRGQNKFPQLFEVVSCDLHVTHEAFQSVVKFTELELDKILKGMWKLLMKL